MSKAIFNLEALISVQIHDKKECRYISFQKFKKGLIWDDEEGFVFVGGSGVYSKEYLEAGKLSNTKLLVEGEKAYYPPYVVLSFVGGKTVTKQFRTYEEALAFGDKMAVLSIKPGFKHHVELP